MGCEGWDDGVTIGCKRFVGVEELDEEKLPDLLKLKYHAIQDASEMLGGVENIRTTFFDFQKYLYERKTG